MPLGLCGRGTRRQVSWGVSESWVVPAVPVASSSCWKPHATGLYGAPATRAWKQGVVFFGSSFSSLRGSSPGKGVPVFGLLPALLTCRLRLQSDGHPNSIGACAGPCRSLRSPGNWKGDIFQKNYHFISGHFFFFSFLRTVRRL